MMTDDEAAEFRTGWNLRVRQLSRFNKTKLRDIEAEGLRRQGIQRVMGGPVSKDELMRAILEMEYPNDKLNESTHVLFHNPGESWSACNWCHPHNGQTCECDARTV